MKFAGQRGTVALVALMLIVAGPAWAQKNKSKNTPTKAADTPAYGSSPMLPQPDAQVVDRAIGEYLGYWQIGDVDSMHKYCADDMLTVSGDWEPPLIGWDNYLKAYLAQRALVTAGRIDRSNTYIKVNGNSAWATYQFLYAATLQGKVVGFKGHTTLLFNKQGERWVIVLNHSSVVSTTEPSSQATATPEPSGQ